MPHRLVIPFIPPGNGRRGSRRGWEGRGRRGGLGGRGGGRGHSPDRTTVQRSFIVIFSQLQNKSQASYGTYGRTQKGHPITTNPTLGCKFCTVGFRPPFFAFSVKFVNTYGP